MLLAIGGAAVAAVTTPYDIRCSVFNVQCVWLSIRIYGKYMRDKQLRDSVSRTTVQPNIPKKPNQRTSQQPNRRSSQQANKRTSEQTKLNDTTLLENDDELNINVYLFKYMRLYECLPLSLFLNVSLYAYAKEPM